MRIGLALAVCALAVAGCATPEDNNTQSEYAAPVYRTGSNIPAGRESAKSREARELSPEERRMLEDMQNRPRQPTGVTK